MSDELKSVFNEVYSRLDNESSIKKVYKSYRENISPSNLPFAMMSPMTDSPHPAGRGIIRNAGAMRDFKIIVGLYWYVDNIDDVSEDALDWVLLIKKLILASPENLGCLVADIRVLDAIYEGSQERRYKTKTYSEAGIEVIFGFDVLEDYS